MHARFELVGVVERCKAVSDGVELTITIDAHIPHRERSPYRVVVTHAPFIKAALARLDRHWRVRVAGSILPKPIERKGKRLQVVALVVGKNDLFETLD